MSIKSILLSVLIIISSIRVDGQNKPHLISLTPEGSLSQNFYITEVIDSRLNRENIGVIQKGISNKQTPAMFDDTFEKYLLKTFRVLLPNVEPRKPLKVSVRTLSISERTSAFSELGSCDVVLEFLKEKDSSVYSLGTFSSLVEGKGADVTGKHDERILEAITDCILQFSESKWEENEGVKVHLEEEQADFVFNPESPLQKGLYTNFNDFISNTPIDTVAYDVYILEQNKKVDRHQIYYHGTKRRVKNLFGFSDGKDVYLNASSFTQAEYFIKSKSIGRYIYFEDNFYSPVAAVAFGAIGAAASTKHRGIVLDTKSGLTKVLDDDNMRTILSSYPSLLSEYDRGNGKVESVRAIIIKLNLQN